jgi:hypothetical protein
MLIGILIGLGIAAVIVIAAYIYVVWNWGGIK